MSGRSKQHCVLKKGPVLKPVVCFGERTTHYIADESKGARPFSVETTNNKQVKQKDTSQSHLLQSGSSQLSNGMLICSTGMFVSF